MTKSGGEFYTSPEMRTTTAFKDIPGLLKKAVHVNFLKEDDRVYLVEAAPRAFGKKLKLAGAIKLEPSGASTTLTWISSDPAIATVSAKGVVNGRKKGTVTITVTTANGKTARAKVKVK